MEYQVPQFIEEETKIIGPLSLKQFFIFMAAGIVSFLFFFFLDFLPWFILTLFLLIVTAILALGKVHGRPASTVALHALRYFWKPRLFLWTKPAMKPEELFVKEKETKGAEPKKEAKVLTPEKIKELAQHLNRRNN